MSRAQVKSLPRSRFFKVTADQVLGFRLDQGLKPGYYSGRLLAVCFLSKFSRGYEVRRFG